MLLPYRQKNPPERFPWVTLSLIVINVAVFAVMAQGPYLSDAAAQAYGLSYNNASSITPFLTSMFTHGDVMHLLGNMFFLYLFGWALEGRVRWWRFLIIYFVGGLCGDFLHLGFFGAMEPDLPSIGASGAVMAVMGAAMWTFPHSTVLVFYWYFVGGVAEWKLYWVALLYIFYDLVGLVLLGAANGVANLAHLGGVAGGLLLAMAMRVTRDNEHVAVSKAHLSDMKGYHGLTRTELADLASVEPENTQVALAWMQKSLEGGMSVKPECAAHFSRLSRKIMMEEDPADIGRTFMAMSNSADVSLDPSMMVDVAQRLEKAGNAQLAMHLLEKARMHPEASDDCREQATFRLAQICEQWFQNYPRAQELYQEHCSKWPMSPMSGMARTQLQSVQMRLAAQPSAAQQAADWGGHPPRT